MTTPEFVDKYFEELYEFKKKNRLNITGKNLEWFAKDKGHNTTEGNIVAALERECFRRGLDIPRYLTVRDLIDDYETDIREKLEDGETYQNIAEFLAKQLNIDISVRGYISYIKEIEEEMRKEKRYDLKVGDAVTYREYYGTTELYEDKEGEIVGIYQHHYLVKTEHYLTSIRRYE